MQVGNVTYTFIHSKGLTQESYVVEEGGLDDGNNDFTLDLEDDTEPGHNIFVSSLLLSLAPSPLPLSCWCHHKQIVG